ncbi:ABC transporter substrate-binding protein [Paenibacillus hamazuiensis]|uniref:ABC transporter substrate-binding protein n=1 Tax=Paenibacillus hamazuiensis TaxID=2936508 RepID=UPI00200E2720|nr:extracellular solute-binding protein [Paenibacillus hamazuiensis]
MRRRNKWISLLCIASLVGVATVGCATATGPAQGADGGKGKKDEVTLRFSWWGSEGRHKALLQAIDLYMSKNPHVKIEAEYSGFDGYYQKLVTQFAGRTAPDLTPLSADWIDDIAVKGDLVLDLNKQKDNINFQAFDQQFISKYVNIGGKIVGLPMGVNGLVFSYNKDFFKKFNIPEDTKWNWNNINEIGKRVHQQDANAYLLGPLEFRTFLQPYIAQKTGKQWIGDDRTLGFDAAVLTEAFAFYKKLLDDGVVQPVAESSLYTDFAKNVAFQKGNIGGTFALASSIPSLKAFVPSLDAAMFPIPDDAKASGVLVIPSNPLAINKETKHPEEAAKFASWLLTDVESAMVLKDNYSVPPSAANAQALADKQLIDPTVAKAVKIALEKPGDPVNGISNNQEIAKLTNDYMQQVAFGQLTPDKGAKELVDRVTDKLKTIK